MSSLLLPAECSTVLDYLSYLLMTVSFLLGVMFFSKKSTHNNISQDSNIPTLDEINMEQSFFLQNSDDLIRRKTLF